MPPNPRHWNRLEELLQNERFLQEVEAIKRKDQFQQIIEISWLLKTFKLPTSYWGLISHYVATGSVDKGLVSLKASLGANEGGVSIELAYDITQPELVAFVKDHWHDIIRPRLEAIGGKRPRVSSVHYAARDHAAYEAYKQRKLNKRTVRDVAMQFGMTEGNIYKIARRQQNLH